MHEIVITENEQNQRLDRFLRKYLNEAALGHIYKMIRKDVKLNGKRANAETMLKYQDVLQLYISDEDLRRYKRQIKKTGVKQQFNIIYEDENIIIADKPEGLLTHGDKTEKKNTLTNQIIDYLISKGDYKPRIEKTFTPAAVNRLDRNTSGLIIFGKNFAAVQTLNQMIRERTAIRKLYLAACFGEIETELSIRNIVQKDECRNKVKVEPIPNGKGVDAETVIRPLAKKPGYTLVEAELLTGRTHQIRVHLATQGFPIIGDPKYGDFKKNKQIADRFSIYTQFLHAYKLKFEDCREPLGYMGGKEFSCPLPELLKSCWEQL